jgi:hypothetical protein
MTGTHDQSPGWIKLFQRIPTDRVTIPLELRLLLFVLDNRPGNERPPMFDPDTFGQVDWNLFLEWTARHKVTTQTLASLSEREQRLVPDHVTERLRLRCRRLALVSLALTARTVELIQLMQSHEVRVLPMKGLCTGQQLYGALEAREPGDIDLVVAPEDADTADNLLRSQGYRCANMSLKVTRLQKAKLLKWAHSLEYIDPHAPISIDLHWRIHAYSSLLSLDFDTLWVQGELVDLAGHKVRTLSLEHALILCVAHGASQAWSHLIWLCDLAQALERIPPLNWDRILSEAGRLGVIRHLTQGLVLANVLLGAPIPEEARPCIDNEPLWAYLIGHSIKKIISSEPDPRTLVESARQARYLLRLSDKLPYKWEVLSHVGLHPPDWKVVQIPDALFPLYYILRPFLWLGRKFRSAK